MVRRVMRSTVKRSTTVWRPAWPRLRAKAGSPCSRRMAAAMASGAFSTSHPFSPWRMISGKPPTSLASTGTAADMARSAPEPARVATVATGSVVDEVLDPTVFGRDRGLVAVLVADNAGEHRIVRGVAVAIAARGPFALVVTAVDREVGRVVRRVGGPVPVHEGMARIAGGREARGGVSGCRGVRVVGLVATVAIAGCGGVVVAHVALDAQILSEHGGVVTGQCERRGRVGERGAGPVGGGVAHGAVLRESRRRV